jgi:hypothetical protein
MKIKSLFVAVLLMAGVVVVVPAQGSDIPELGIFEFSPQEVDLTGASTDVSIRVSFIHPTGIENTKVTAQLSDQLQNTLQVDLFRASSSTANGYTEVLFKGTISIPRTSKSGIYKIRVLSVQSESPSGNSRIVKNIYPRDFRTLKGAENALLLRDNGYLDYDFETFFGPNYDKTKSFNYSDLKYYDNGNSPIWKVGETYNPSDYFELQVKDIVLQLKTETPSTCIVSNGTLRFIQIGSCSFKVFTPRTKDFLYRETNLSATISEARLPVDLTLENLPNLRSSAIGTTITLPSVYSVVERNVQPKSVTLNVCSAVGYLLKITAGGICTLNYQTAGTPTNLPSKIYFQSFEIFKDLQSITFSPTTSVALSNKSLELSATASSGGTVSFAAVPADICAVTGTILSLLKPGSCAVTATQPGTGTIAAVSSSATVLITGALPVVKKTITCVKGKKTVKKTAVSPKCPAGYKLKK